MKQDKRHTIILWEKAAQMKDASASYALGNLYDRGDLVHVDRKKAFQYFQQAAQSGVPAAMHRLGRYYEKGWAAARSYDKAIQCYKDASSFGYPPSQYRLYQLSLEDKSIEDGQEYLERAVRGAFPPALHELAAIYRKHGGADGKKKAVQLELMACRRGYKASCEAKQTEKSSTPPKSL